jgi:heme exporter protein A
MVLRDLSFEVKSGEALTVTGPNGAGKSSLLRLIAGLVDASGGVLKLEGEWADVRLAEQAHYIGHLDALKPAMTVRDTLNFWSNLLGGAVHETEEAVAAFDLARLIDLPVAYLSAGQKRRLSLARLLVAARPLWLLDEPSVALDAASFARLSHAMGSHLERGGLIIAATHQALGIANSLQLDLGTWSVNEDQAVNA